MVEKFNCALDQKRNVSAMYSGEKVTTCAANSEEAPLARSQREISEENAIATQMHALSQRIVLPLTLTC